MGKLGIMKVFWVTLIFNKNPRNMRKIGPREKITTYYMIRLGTL